MRYFTILAATLAMSSAYAAPTEVQLKDAKGETVGTATVTQLAKGVKIDLDLHGVTPGVHGFHIHENGVCAGPKFDSAGGHFNPNKREHGYDTAKGMHEGDMANVIVGADGKAKVEIVNTEVTLASGVNSLLKPGGTAFVLHGAADDYKSQPAGNAGARVACGVIK